MRRFIYLKIAGRDVHMPKLVGAFVLVWALLMFLSSTAVMFDSWDHLKAYDRCAVFSGSDTLADQLDQFNMCSDSLYKATGIVVRPDAHLLTMRQRAQALLEPVAGIFFWLAILFIGWMFYRSDRAILPIEESIREVPEMIVREARRPFAKRRR